MDRISNERLMEIAEWASSEEAECREDDMPVSAEFYADIQAVIQFLRSQPAGVRVDVDARALDLAKRIEREFYYDQPGGAVQTRAKVQAIISEALSALEPQGEEAVNLPDDCHQFAVTSTDYSRPFLLGCYPTLEAAKLAQGGKPEKWDIFIRYTHPAPTEPSREGEAIGYISENTVKTLRNIAGRADTFLRIYAGVKEGWNDIPVYLATPSKPVSVTDERVERAVRVLRRTLPLSPEDRARAVLTEAISAAQGVE